MERPEKVNLKCRHCGHTWLEPTRNLLALKVTVYRDDDEGVSGEDNGSVTRQLECPNCDKWVNVSVPEEWLADE